MKKLNSAVVSQLIENGVNAVGISPCLNIPRLMVHGGDEYNGVTLLIQSIRDTLAAGLVPVIHGDAGLYGTYSGDGTRRDDTFESMSAGILGGDTLVEIIATHPMMKNAISKIVFLTDVDGVYTKDPKAFSDATLVRNIFIDAVSGTVMNEVSASGSLHEHDVTGGLEVRKRLVFCQWSICWMEQLPLILSIGNVDIHCFQIIKAKLGAAATVAKTGVDVIVAKCGSAAATICMSEVVVGANTHDNTLIRVNQN